MSTPRQNAQIMRTAIAAIQQQGYRDGLKAISFSPRWVGASLTLMGWFEDLGGQHYQFAWNRDRLTYSQARSPQPALTYHAQLPPLMAERSLKRLSAQQRATLRDRGTYACGLSRIGRHRTCQVTNPTLRHTFEAIARHLPRA